MSRCTLPLVLALALCLPGAAAPTAAARPVPYRLTDSQHLLVRARVNGKGPFHFIVDTGAPSVYLSPAAAKRAGLAADPSGWAVMDRLELEGGTLLEKIETRVEEPPQLTGMNAMGLAGSRLDGILGYTVLSRFRIEIDLATPVMQWTPVPYQPLPLLGLKDLTQGKKLPPNPNSNAIQALSRFASLLFARPAPPPPVARGFLGLELAPEAGGLRVGSVLGGSPAAVAGVKVGDRILQATAPGGSTVAVKTPEELVKVASAVAADEELQLEVERAGQPVKLSVRGAKGTF